MELAPLPQLADSFFTSRPPLLASGLLAELGPVLTSREAFPTADGALEVVMAAIRTRWGAVWLPGKTGHARVVCGARFCRLPQTAVFPLLPKHVRALTNVAGPQRISRERCDTFLSSTGNISSVWFRCIAPLKVSGS